MRYIKTYKIFEKSKPGTSVAEINDLLADLDNLRFANYWHVQHYKGKYWYAFLVVDGDIVTTGDVFGGERIYAPFIVDIPHRLLSDAVKQDIKAMEKIFEAHLCAIGCDAVAMFEDCVGA